MAASDSAHEIQPRLEAARLLDRLVRRLLSEEESLHAETWLLTLGRLAGTALRWQLLDSTTDRGHEPAAEWAGGAGAGAGARGQSGSGPVGPALEENGSRLVDLLLRVLAGLGMPLEAAAIDPPAESFHLSQLSLAQTRARLGPLVQACGRAHGLGAGAMADALMIAAALAVGQCAAVLPPQQGAALAVAGLVEGARMAEQELLAA